MEGKGKGEEVQGGRGKGGEVDSDAQLEQGHRLAKASPAFEQCRVLMVLIKQRSSFVILPTLITNCSVIFLVFCMRNNPALVLQNRINHLID